MDNLKNLFNFYNEEKNKLSSNYNQLVSKLGDVNNNILSTNVPTVSTNTPVRENLFYPLFETFDPAVQQQQTQESINWNNVLKYILIIILIIAVVVLLSRLLTGMQLSNSSTQLVNASKQALIPNLQIQQPILAPVELLPVTSLTPLEFNY